MLTTVVRKALSFRATFTKQGFNLLGFGVARDSLSALVLSLACGLSQTPDSSKFLELQV